MTTAILEKPAATAAEHFADALRAATLDDTYLAKAARYDISIDGMASRIQQAFGLGRLYSRSMDGGFYTSGKDLRSDMIRGFLQSIGLDIVLEGILGYGTPNPNRVCITEFDSVFERRELGQFPKISFADYRGTSRYAARQKCMAAVQSVIETPNFRDRVGADLSEIF